MPIYEPQIELGDQQLYQFKVTFPKDAFESSRWKMFVGELDRSLPRSIENYAEKAKDNRADVTGKKWVVDCWIYGTTERNAISSLETKIRTIAKRHANEEITESTTPAGPYIRLSFRDTGEANRFYSDQATKLPGYAAVSGPEVRIYLFDLTDKANFRKMASDQGIGFDVVSEEISLIEQIIGKGN